MNMENLNQLKLENQVEVATQVMVQMDKLPFHFCAGSDSDDDPSFPTSVFSAATATASASGSLSNLRERDSSPVASPGSTDNNPLLPVQEQSRQPHMCLNSSTRTCRWKNNGDLSSTNAFTSTIEKQKSMGSMREMMYRIAAMQPINIDPESVKPPKRRNVRISKDPQSIAARHRRERISEKIRILQRLVPGGTRMDTASMLDEVIHYLKFLKTQVQSLERYSAIRPTIGVGFPPAMSTGGGMLNISPEEIYRYQVSQHVQYQVYPES